MIDQLWQRPLVWTTSRTAYYQWRHFVRKSLRYAAMYENGNHKAFTYGAYARTDAAYWANVLYDLTDVWPTYETSD